MAMARGLLVPVRHDVEADQQVLGVLDVSVRQHQPYRCGGVGFRNALEGDARSSNCWMPSWTIWVARRRWSLALGMMEASKKRGSIRRQFKQDNRDYQA
jgi:hypothetical protein